MAVYVAGGVPAYERTPAEVGESATPQATTWPDARRSMSGQRPTNERLTHDRHLRRGQPTTGEGTCHRPSLPAQPGVELRRLLDLPARP